MKRHIGVVILGTLAFSLNIYNSASADYNEIDFNNISIVSTVASMPCVDSVSEAQSFLHQSNDTQTYFPGQWAYHIQYMGFDNLDQRAYQSFESITGFKSADNSSERIQWLGDSIIQIGGDSDHCRGFGMRVNSGNEPYAPADFAGPGLGIQYGRRWDEDNVSQMPRPYALPGRNLMVQLSDVNVPVSGSNHNGIRQYNFYVYFYQPTRQEYLALVVSIFDARSNTLDDCQENRGKNDGNTAFNGTFFGVRNQCSRRNIELITPSPFSSRTVLHDTFSNDRFFRFHVTAKDLQDQLLASGLRNTRSQIDATQWRLINVRVGIELENNPNSPGQITKMAVSGKKLRAFIVTNG